MRCRSGDAFALLEGIRQAPGQPRLYILIHNIDGPGVACHSLPVLLHHARPWACAPRFLAAAHADRIAPGM